ncbi:hypothetical protein CANMA_003813 [Candida margitis]|uniref:uncharacterized protein n=1 Tax=Candida margitis TaxID=1775924 RepID=UPI002225EB35|nr:uncharacterized protein CANMA_003813 [Candida margitis]KAI5961293.1 hypothetical protein CANMA_003813 [Candida margitis]
MDKLIQVLNQPPSKNDLDEAYLSRLIKDLKRIQEYTKQAEKAIESFDKIESVSIEKHIIALYDSYGSIPYTPEKNDTIATAATSVILEEMIQEKQKEIAQPCEESKKAEFDFTGNIDELKKQRATRLEQIKELSLAIDREFLSPLPSKWAESLELQRTLSSYLKKVLIKYLAISDRTSGSVNNKDQCDREQPCKTCHRLKRDCSYTLAMESKDASKSRSRQGASNSISIVEIPPIKSENESWVGRRASNYVTPGSSTSPQSLGSINTDQAADLYQSEAQNDPNLSEVNFLKQRVQELENQLKTERLSNWNRSSSIPPTTWPRSATTPTPGQTNFNYSFTDGKPLLLSDRPFPYMLLMRREGGSKLLYNLLARDGEKDGHLLTSSILLCELNDIRTREIKEKARMMLGDYYIPFQGEETTNIEELKRKIALNHYGLQFIPPEVDLRDPIACYFSLIPPAWVSKKLLDIYFQALYPFMPIIDEQEFRSALSRILGPQINDNYINTFPNVDSSDDLAILAILLIVLRSTYLSLWDLHGNSLSSLSQYSVTYDAVRAAETILKEFDLTYRQSLTVVQAGLMYRSYVIIAPEAFFTGSTAQVKLGPIIQLCYALGLNRDPACFKDQTPKMQNLRRKIWHFVVRVDIACSGIFGTTLSTDVLTYDCPLPEFSIEAVNCFDLKMEKDIVDSFHRSHEVYLTCRKLADYHLIASDIFQVDQVIKVVEGLELTLTKAFGNVKPLFNQPLAGFMDVFSMQVYMEMKPFIAYTCYCLHLYYESQSNHLLSSKYFLKTMTILLQDLGDLNTYIFSNANSSFNMLLSAKFTEFYLHFNLMVFTGIRLRLKCYMHLKSSTSDNGEKSIEHEILYKLENQLKIYTHAQAIKLGELAKKYRYSLVLRGMHMITIKLCDQFQYLLSANDTQAVKEAAIKLPLEVLQKFSQKLDVYQLTKTGKLFDFSDEGLIAEMSRQNLWSQLKMIETEETVTSAWIEKTKKFNRFAEDMKLGFSYNLGFDLSSNGLDLFSS